MPQPFAPQIPQQGMMPPQGMPEQQPTTQQPPKPQQQADDYEKKSPLPSEKQQEKAVKLIIKTYEFYARSRKSSIYHTYSTTNRVAYNKPQKAIEDKWLEYWMLYRQVLFSNANVSDGRAKVMMGKSYQIVNLIVPRIEQVIFGNKDYFSATGFEPNDIEAAEKLKKLLYWNMELVNVRKKLAATIKNNVLYGTCILRVFWNTKTTTEIKRRKLSTLREGTPQEQSEYARVINSGKYGDDSLVPMEIKQLDADHADVEVIDPAMFYMHPTNACNNAKIEKRYVSYESLKRTGYYFQENVDKAKDEEMSNDEYDWFIQERQRMAGISSQSGDTSQVAGNESDIDGKKHQILVFWGNFPIDPSDKDEKGNVNKPMCEIHLLNQKHIICMRKSPYWYSNKDPYIIGAYDKNEGESYGEGALAPSSKQLHLLNTTISQIADNISLVLAAPMKVRGSLKFPSIMRLLPGQVLNFPDQYDPNKDMVPVNIPDIANTGWNSIAQIEQRIESDTGAVKLLSGVSAGGGIDNTKGGINAALGEANVRFKSAIWHFQEDVVRELIRWFAKLNQQFLTVQKQVRILNPEDQTTYETINVSPEDINIDCDFIMANAATELDKAKNKQSLMEFIQVGNHYEDPQTGGYKVSAAPILKMAWDAFDREDWERAKKELFPPPPPPPEPGSTMEEQELALKAKTEEGKLMIDSERVKTERMRVFGEFIRNMGTPDPAKAGLYEAMWIGLGLPAEEYENIEMGMFAGELMASKQGMTGPDIEEEKENIPNNE